MNLYIYQGFNNYFNRQIKKYDTLAEYGSHSFSQINVNFNPNDNINTSLIIGGINNYDGSGDYLIVADGTEIISRWYILENARERGGQYKLTLRRDLITDFYQEVMDSTIYLEKGWINDVSNPAIFNAEQYSPNQIKINETPLMDKSKCKWLIGYVDKADKSDDKTFWNGSEMRTDASGNIRYDEVVSSWADWDLYPFISGNYTAPSNITFKWTRYSTTYSYKYEANRNGFVSFAAERGTPTNTTKKLAEQWGADIAENYDALDEYSYSQLGADITMAQYQHLLNLNGKIVFSENEQQYITITATATASYGKSDEINLTSSTAPRAWELLEEIGEPYYGISQESRYCYASTYYKRISTSYTTTSDRGIQNYKWQTSEQGHAHLVNEAYDAFAIPIATEEAGAVHIWDGSVDEDGNPNYGWVVADENCAFITAHHLIETAGSGGYDLQLVPYSPLEDSLIAEDSSGTRFDVSQLTHGFDYSIVRLINNTAKGVIFWMTRNKFSHVINHSIENKTDPIEIKKANQLDIYRLSSGDYSSQFEFSPVRNRGVSYFEADCTYKPFAPYIRVCPYFNANGLYGEDWNDARGLVCSNTNYSISRANDAWATYERNNLNYLNSWQREIEHMDEMHKYDMISSGIRAAVGGFGGGAGVGLASSSVGLGVAAGVVSAGLGAVDVVNSHFRYQAEKDNSIAAHDENIANIKAQPNTLAATGANTINNKIFPLLVYYSCTEEEKTNFEYKLEYEGMTINRIVKNLSNFLSPTEYQTFIRGLLMRIFVNEDNHLAQEIANELNRGIYIINNEYEERSV